MNTTKKFHGLTPTPLPIYNSAEFSCYGHIQFSRTLSIDFHVLVHCIFNIVPVTRAANSNSKELYLFAKLKLKTQNFVGVGLNSNSKIFRARSS